MTDKVREPDGSTHPALYHHTGLAVMAGHADSTYTDEIWKPVPGFEDRYEVSDYGRMKSLKSRPRGVRILKPGITRGRGYHGYHLYRSGGNRCGYHRLVHVWVLLVFVGPKPGPEYEARHLDGNPGNNRVSNLEWSTHQVNMADKYRHGTVGRGEKGGTAYLTEKIVLQIKAFLEEGRPPIWIARALGVPNARVKSIRKGHSWGWFTGATPGKPLGGHRKYPQGVRALKLRPPVAT